jgi:Zn-dependent protease/CBS domain-containing protein
MRWSLKLGQVSGIDIRLHVTFIFVIIWAAAQGASGMGGARGALFAAVTILLVFVCVTLHELGHSLVALRTGVRVRDITLLPIGGLARLETLPKEPLHELLIALSGPAVNFALAVGLGLGLVVIGGAGGDISLRYLPYMLMQPGSFLSLLVYLVAANLLLGVFNLIPAFPMDGGRVLRAMLAMWTSYPRATRIAARIGQMVAVALVLLAFSPFGNYSLIFIALFVFTGASFEDQMVRVRSKLGGLRVRQAMPTRRVSPVAAGDTLDHVMGLRLLDRQRDFPVFREGVLVGILFGDDLLKVVRRDGGYVRVEEAMRSQFPTLSPDEPLLGAQQLLAGSGLSALPVLDRGFFLGLVSLEDIKRAYANLSWQRR